MLSAAVGAVAVGCRRADDAAGVAKWCWLVFLLSAQAT